MTIVSNSNYIELMLGLGCDTSLLLLLCLNMSSLLELTLDIYLQKIFGRDALGKPSKKKYYLVREFVPIPSDTPTIETVSEYLDRECW